MTHVLEPTAAPLQARSINLLLFAFMTSRWVAYGFSEVALAVILRDAGASLFQISLMLGAGVLFMFKFLWAPLVDRRRAGERPCYRAWYAWSQLGLAAALCALWPLRPEAHFYAIFAVMVTASIVASFRDIAMDGLAIEMVSESQRAGANGWLSAGFMLGMLLGGGMLLLAYEYIGWSGAVAALILSTLATLPLMGLIRRAAPASAPPTGIARSWSQSFKSFFAVAGNRRWSAFLVCHAISAVAGSSLIGLILVDIGWSVARIGFVLNIVGPATAAGASVLAGWVFARYSRGRSLIVMMILQALLNLALLPLIGKSYSYIAGAFVVVTLVVATTVANLIIKTVAMDKAASSDDKATYFTLQGSLSQVGGLLALVTAPSAAQVLGYGPVIAFGVVAGLACVSLLISGVVRSSATAEASA